VHPDQRRDLEVEGDPRRSDRGVDGAGSAPIRSSETGTSA